MSKTLLKSTTIFSVMTFLSRIFGFIRDIVIAYYFGASGFLDAFLVAFRIPNLMRRLFAEGAFSHAFVPILSDYRRQSGQEMQIFLRAVSGNLLCVLVLITCLGILFAPFLVCIFTPGFEVDSPKTAAAVTMLRITFPYLLLIAMTAFFAGILHTANRFASASFAPVLLNISMILAAVSLTGFFAIPVTSLAVGVLIGGVLQFVFLLWVVNKKEGFVPWPVIDWQHPGVRKILTLMVPALFGVSVHQLNNLVDTIFASFLVSGSISWLYYADRLMEFPLGIIGVGLGTVLLPNLSRVWGSGDKVEYMRSLEWGVKGVLLLSLPAAVGLCLLAGPMVATLFQSGNFDLQDTLKTKMALMAYAPGLIGLMFVKVLASAFYAQKNIKTPVIIAAIALVVNIFFNIVLIGPLAHAGLALATSLSALSNALILFICLYRVGHVHYRALGTVSLQVLCGVACMAVLLWWVTPGMETWQVWGKLARFIYLGGYVFLGMLVYAAGLWISGFKFRIDMIKRGAQ